MVHANVIDAVNKGRRRVLAAEFKIERFARLDLLVYYFPGQTYPLAGLGIVNPKFDVAHRDGCGSQILEPTRRAVLAGVMPGLQLDRQIGILRTKRQSERQQQERCAEWAEEDFHELAPLNERLRVSNQQDWSDFEQASFTTFPRGLQGIVEDILADDTSGWT
jgi:hypothetical protein